MVIITKELDILIIMEEVKVLKILSGVRRIQIQKCFMIGIEPKTKQTKETTNKKVQSGTTIVVVPLEDLKAVQVTDVDKGKPSKLFGWSRTDKWQIALAVTKPFVKKVGISSQV